jgi:hypothetical protein
MWRRLMGVVCCGWLAACGGGDEADAGPAVLRTKQESLKPEAWQAELTAAPDLAALVPAGLALQSAGVIEDSAGKRLVWAEYANTADSPVPISGELAREQATAVYRLCDKAKVCQAAAASYTATGASVGNVAIGAPVLRLDLKNHNYTTDPQTVLAPLTSAAGDGGPLDRATAQETIGKVQWKTRRFVVLNAFGPALGVSAQAIVDAAKTSGLYQSVELIDYARRSDLWAVAPTLTPRDALVWIGDTVRDTKAGVTQPVGLTLSRGVVGDEMIHAKQIVDLLRTPVLGGPGLVVLVGAGTLAPATQKEALCTLLADRTLRPVVGFGGKVAIKDAVPAVARLVGALGGGQAMAAALAAGGQGLGSTLDPTTAAGWKLPVKDAALWAKTPSSAQLKVLVAITPSCRKMAKSDVCDVDHINQAAAVQAPDILNGTMTLDCDATIDGAWLSCEGASPGMGQQFSLKGVLTGAGVGDHLVLYADGDGANKYQQLTLLGDGVIAGIDKGGGTTTLEIGGAKAVSYAAMSPYLDDAGRCCQAVNPFLQGTQGEACKLVLKF